MEKLTTKEVMQYLDGMGVCVNLEVVGKHRWNAGAKIDCHHQQFINEHYSQIIEYLLEERFKKKHE